METDLMELLAEVEQILDGIDREETSEPPGWWETSTGAEAGKERLARIREAFERKRLRCSMPS